MPTDLQPGDTLRTQMGPFTAKLVVIAPPTSDKVGSVRFGELYQTKGHKPEPDGMGQCVHCDRPIHFVETTYLIPREPPVGYWRHNPIARTRAIHDNDRTHCSSCGRPFPAYELKPGDGRCKECMT